MNLGARFYRTCKLRTGAGVFIVVAATTASLVLASCVVGQTNNGRGAAPDRPSKADDQARLTIKAVMMPRSKSRPLQIMLTLAAVGKIPLAVPQKLFSVRLSGENHREVFVGDALFSTNTDSVIKVPAQMQLVLDLTTLSNRLGGGLWSNLPGGTYELRVHIDAPKEPMAKDQWQGEADSDVYELNLN